MCRSRQKWLLIMIVFIFLLFSTNRVLWAQGKGDIKIPSGWEKGEKRGWEGNVPPGIEKKGNWLPPGLNKGKPEKWDKGKRETWEKELKKAKTKLRKKAKRLKEFSKGDIDMAVLSLESAARRGVPIKYTSEILGRCMEKGIKGRELETISKALSYGVDKEVVFDKISNFVYKRLSEGVKDNELSIEIYKEIEKLHKKALKVKE